jgi:hypothetical protein
MQTTQLRRTRFQLNKTNCQKFPFLSSSGFGLRMEIAYNNKETNKFYKELNSIKEGFKTQTLLFTEKESNIVSYKEKVLNQWRTQEYFSRGGGSTNSVEDRGQGTGIWGR